MADVLWYYAKNDRQLGPVSPGELKRLAGGGELLPDDLIWREGMEGWAPAAKVKGLFPEPVEPIPLTPPAVTDPPPAPPPSAFAPIASVPRNTPLSPPPSQATPPPSLGPLAQSDIIPPFRSPMPMGEILWTAQVVLWSVCAAVVLLGGLLFTRAFISADSSADESAAGSIYTTFFIGAYVIARAGERVTALLQSRFDRKK